MPTFLFFNFVPVVLHEINIYIVRRYEFMVVDLVATMDCKLVLLDWVFHVLNVKRTLLLIWLGHALERYKQVMLCLCLKHLDLELPFVANTSD